MKRSDQKLLLGPIEGYKAMNADMTCRGFQFEVGNRHALPDLETPLSLCNYGFHFCPQPSGVWSYYPEGRVFKVKAYGVLDTPIEPGADFKMVCSEIEIMEEIMIDGHQNTGDRNTGHQNTGDRNTGDRNTGNWNTGNWNTGDQNTGHRNTGDRNTGDRNTGNWNTGDRNTGDRNTGDQNTGHRNTGGWNTGDRNTGDRNTGDRNTGYQNTGHRNTGGRNTGNWNTGDRNTGHWNTGNCNVGNYHSGYFNHGEAPLYLFNKKVSVHRDNLPCHLIDDLSRKLMSDEPFDPTPYLSIPNATVNKIKKLHKAHIAARKAAKGGDDK